MTESATVQFPTGLAGTASVCVVPDLTPPHLRDQGVAVFATPEMVRLMELAAINALGGHLLPGQQSVGISLSVQHLAPTPVGATVTARAEVLAFDGKRITLRVTAHDGADLIGEGTHERAVIDVARFGARVAAKQTAQAASRNASVSDKEATAAS